MTSREAINALFEGKKIKLPNWQNRYIYMKVGVPTYKDIADDSEYLYTADLFRHINWEIYNEPVELYNWLCMDSKGDFFISIPIEGTLHYGPGSAYKVLRRLDETKRVVS